MRALFLIVFGLGCSSSSEAVAPVDSGDDAAIDAADETAIDSGIPTPTPSDLSFKPLSPLPSGEQIVFNDWTASPNTLKSMKPDGSGAITVFQIFRLWSVGISRKGDKIAFACGDPKQKEHYGLEILDSIQHTWMYDVATQSIAPIAVGNVNDECHEFSPDGARLYVCRRYDFAETKTDAGVSGTFKGWRLARIDLSAPYPSTFLTPESSDYTLGPQPTPDEKELWYSITHVEAGKQKLRIVKQALPDGAPTDVKTDAARPALSPDGSHCAYNAVNTTDKSALHVAKLDGSEDVKVTSAAGTNARFSPDGSHLAYLVYDGALGCQHVEVVASDGADLAAPKRIRDCGTTKEFISDLAWISR